MGILVVVFCLFLYFLPAIICIQRNHKNGTAIIVLNLLTGWTFIGWVIALVWSFTDNTKQNKTELKITQE